MQTSNQTLKTFSRKEIMFLTNIHFQNLSIQSDLFNPRVNTTGGTKAKREKQSNSLNERVLI